MSTNIPVARPDLGDEEWKAVREVIQSGWVTQGPRVAAFESALAQACGAEHAVAVSSCTTALHLALVCAGVGPGDEVIVPSMSFIATANAVVHAGAVPVFAEVDPVTFNLDAADVERRIGDRTAAILLVHQLGLPADIRTFQELADSHSLRLIEDAACAIGSAYEGSPIGSHGEFVCFSFHPRKLVTTGDGGAILTPSKEHADLLRRLRQHGMSVSDTARHRSRTVVREAYLEVGYNYRLTDIQAAVGIEQLRRLPEHIARRQEIARIYDQSFADHEHIRTPQWPDGDAWNVQSYAIRLEGWSADARDAVMQALLDQGISSRPGVMTAHREPAYESAKASLPVSEAASDSSMILPVFAGLSDAQTRDVARAVIDAVDTISVQRP